MRGLLAVQPEITGRVASSSGQLTHTAYTEPSRYIKAGVQERSNSLDSVAFRTRSVNRWVEYHLGQWHLKRQMLLPPYWLDFCGECFDCLLSVHFGSLSSARIRGLSRFPFSHAFKSRQTVASAGGAGLVACGAGPCGRLGAAWAGVALCFVSWLSWARQTQWASCCSRSL